MTHTKFASKPFRFRFASQYLGCLFPPKIWLFYSRLGLHELCQGKVPICLFSWNMMGSPRNFCRSMALSTSLLGELRVQWRIFQPLEHWWRPRTKQSPAAHWWCAPSGGAGGCFLMKTFVFWTFLFRVSSAFICSKNISSRNIWPRKFD